MTGTEAGLAAAACQRSRGCTGGSITTGTHRTHHAPPLSQLGVLRAPGSGGLREVFGSSCNEDVTSGQSQQPPSPRAPRAWCHVMRAHGPLQPQWLGDTVAAAIQKAHGDCGAGYWRPGRGLLCSTRSLRGSLPTHWPATGEQASTPHPALPARSPLRRADGLWQAAVRGWRAARLSAGGLAGGLRVGRLGQAGAPPRRRLPHTGWGAALLSASHGVRESRLPVAWADLGPEAAARGGDGPLWCGPQAGRAAPVLGVGRSRGLESHPFVQKAGQRSWN